MFADNIASIGNTNAVGQTGWEKMKNLSFAQHFTDLNNFDFFKFKETLTWYLCQFWECFWVMDGYIDGVGDID